MLRLHTGNKQNKTPVAKHNNQHRGGGQGQAGRAAGVGALFPAVT